MNLNKNSFLLNDISSLKGVGSKTKKYLEKKLESFYFGTKVMRIHEGYRKQILECSKPYQIA